MSALQPEHTCCRIKMAAKILITIVVVACTLQMGLAEDMSSDDVLAKLDQLSEEAEAGVKEFAASVEKKFDGKCLSTLVQDLTPLVEQAASKAVQCVKDVKDDIEKNGMKDIIDDIRKAEMCEGAAIQGFAMKAEPVVKAALKCAEGA